MSLLKFSSVFYMGTRWELKIFLKIQYHRPSSNSLSANLILGRVIFWESKKNHWVPHILTWSKEPLSYHCKDAAFEDVPSLSMDKYLLDQSIFFFTAKYFCSAAFHIISVECLWHPSWDALVITYTWSHDGYSSPLLHLTSLWEIPVYFIWHITLQFRPADTVIKSSVKLDIW